MQEVTQKLKLNIAVPKPPPKTNTAKPLYNCTIQFDSRDAGKLNSEV